MLSNYNVQVHAKREAVAWVWIAILKVTKFQKYQNSAIRFFYSMMCILDYALCFIGISVC